MWSIKGSNNLTVIDGATNATTTVTDPSGLAPFAVAVNSETNTIYVLNSGNDGVTLGSVTILNGTTNTTTNINVGLDVLAALAVNSVTNKVYMTNSVPSFVGPSNVIELDGTTHTTNTVLGSGALSLAVNPVTNNVYVAGSPNTVVISEEQVQAIPLTTTINPLAGNTTTSTTPSFGLSAASTFAPTAPPVDAIYVQFDTWQGPWTAATFTAGVGYNATAPMLSLGTHILYAYASDGQDATSIMTTSNGGSSPLIGTIAAYVFTVLAPAGAAVSLPATLDFGSVNLGSSFSRGVFVMNTGTANLTLTSIGPITGVDASDFSVQPALGTCFAGTVVAPGNSCQLYVDFMPTATGARTAAIALVDNAANSPQTMALSGTGAPVPGAITATGGTPQSATVSTPFAAPLAVTVTDVTGAPVSGVTVTFTAPANGASGTFAGGVNTAATNANGVATSAVFTANATAGSYTVNATVPGLNASATFSLTNTAAAGPASITATSGTPQSATIGTAFASPFVASVKTAAGAPVSGATVTFNTPDASGANGAFPGGSVNYTTTTNANGVATSAVFTANSIAGTYTVTATVQGTNLSANFSLTNNNPVPTLTSIAPTSGMVGQSVTLTLTGTNFVSGAVVNFGSNADAGGVESDGTSITITIPASQLTAAGPVNVTVTNPAPTAGPSAAQVFTVNGNGLVIGVNGSVTVSAPTYSFSFPVQSVGGLGGTLNSLCSSATISCLISPCPTNLKANGSVTMTVTLYSTPQATGIFEPGLPGLPGSRRWKVALACLAGLLFLGLLSARKPRLRWAFATAALAFALVGGCGNSGSSSKGVPAGQYAMTITETLGTTTQTAQIILNVQ